jgi:hypothetical protein
MADTNSHHTGTRHVEGDGVSYRGIVWFVVILALTTLVCEGIVVGMFKYFDRPAATAGVVRAPLSAPQGTMPPPPNLLTDEPGNLKHFRQTEEETLHTYGWSDKNAGVVRIPIDRAKALLLERGLPTAAGKADGTGQKAETEAVKSEAAHKEGGN